MKIKIKTPGRATADTEVAAPRDNAFASGVRDSIRARVDKIASQVQQLSEERRQSIDQIVDEGLKQSAKK